MKFSSIRVSLLLMVFSVVLDACQKKDDPQPIQNPTITLITFKWDGSTPTANSDDWIFATDETGNILDIEQFEAGQTVVLTSNKITADQKVNITIFQYFKPFDDRWMFKSYLGLATDQSWTSYNKLPGSPTFPPIAGNFTMNVSNYPAGYPIFFVTTNETNTVGSGPPSSSNYALHHSPSKICISSFRNNFPVYATLNASLGSTYNLNFLTDFKQMEHTLSYDVTGTVFWSMNIRAFDDPVSSINPPQGHIIANYGQGTIPGVGNNVVIGWPDGFAAYGTDIMIGTSNSMKSYYKLGAGASTTPFLNITSSVTNASYKNFTFTASTDYQLRTASWANANYSVTWSVNARPNAVQKFLDIPKELTAKYPILATATLDHKDIAFTKYLDGFTYEDYIQNLAAGTPNSKEYQWTALF